MNYPKNKAAIFSVVLIALVVTGLTGYFYLREDKAADYYEQFETASPNTTTTGRAESKGSPPGMPACVCHSKKPQMVRMHEALEGENCGYCHKGGENLMDPNRAASQPDDLNNRRNSEAICQNCHTDGKTTVKKVQKGKTKISNALFCPKCKKQLDMEDKTCGECGGTVTKSGEDWVCSVCGPLVDVDKIALMSKENPSNDICKICHFDERGLTVAHNEIEAYNKNKATVPGGLNNCLACHESHNQCGGCHF